MEKRKNDDRMADRHAVLDKALDEFAKACHLQMDIAQQTLEASYRGESVEKLEQASQLVALCLEQIRMVTMPSEVAGFLQQKNKERVAQMELLIKQWNLDKLVPLDPD